MLLAFIPARKGSKGIPGKNLLPLGGKPMIQHTIEAALGSRFVDDILISTDDQGVIDLARGLGLECRYKRPDGLAEDQTAMIDTVEHGLLWYEQDAGLMPDEMILLQPTSPLRTSADIDAAMESFRGEGSDTLISVHSMSEHPSECLVDTHDGWHYLSAPPEGAVRRQDFAENFYFVNGAIYIAKTDSLLESRQFVCRGKSTLYIMPRERGVDIDMPLDFALAEVIFRQVSRETSAEG
ncbi:MAG: acylneuraminate cytidylyltransferase family protein [Mariprofundaceae bacterium]|nr:acylneuraminate cytidylyltransferase family protein [Mariprofundaceae bacterium]